MNWSCWALDRTGAWLQGRLARPCQDNGSSSGWPMRGAGEIDRNDRRITSGRGTRRRGWRHARRPLPRNTGPPLQEQAGSSGPDHPPYPPFTRGGKVACAGITFPPLQRGGSGGWTAHEHPPGLSKRGSGGGQGINTRLGCRSGVGQVVPASPRTQKGCQEEWRGVHNASENRARLDPGSRTPPARSRADRWRFAIDSGGQWSGPAQRGARALRRGPAGCAWQQ
jgi:hypothetical protein